MVAALGYEAYRRFFGSTSRDQKGELQLMVQVGPHAYALFAAKAGSAEQADYSLTGIAEQYAKQGKVLPLANRASPTIFRSRKGRACFFSAISVFF